MQSISNEELERMFDEGEDIMDYADLSSVSYPNQHRVEKGIDISLTVPEHVVRGIDRAAARIGIDRQSVIKVWLAERLEQETGVDPRMASAGA